MKKFIITLAVTLTACASTGVQVNERDLESFIENKTTLQDVVTKLGAPTTVMKNPDGTRTVMYVYASAAARPESFIPILGAFIGGSDVKSSSVMINFNTDNTLKSYSSSSSEMGTGVGLSSQTTFEENRTNQPIKAE